MFSNSPCCFCLKRDTRFQERGRHDDSRHFHEQRCICQLPTMFLTDPPGPRWAQHAQSQHTYPKDRDDLQTAGRPVWSSGNDDSFGLFWFQVNFDFGQSQIFNKARFFIACPGPALENTCLLPLGSKVFSFGSLRTNLECRTAWGFHTTDAITETISRVRKVRRWPAPNRNHRSWDSSR